MPQPKSIAAALEPRVRAFVAEIANLVQSQIRDVLLAQLGGRTAAAPAKPRRAAAAPRAARAARPVSAKQRRALVLQGRYLGSIRTLSPADREKVKALREKAGIEKAIALAKELQKKA
jgi:hypothetical protein